MNLELKALQLLNAKSEQEIDEAISLFTDNQKDMMLKVLLKYCRGEKATSERIWEKINQV